MPEMLLWHERDWERLDVALAALRERFHLDPTVV